MKIENISRQIFFLDLSEDLGVDLGNLLCVNINNPHAY